MLLLNGFKLFYLCQTKKLTKETIMDNPTLSAESQSKVPEYVKLVKENLENSGTKVEANVLQDALLKAQKVLGCDQCANGMRW